MRKATKIGNPLSLSPCSTLPRYLVEMLYLSYFKVFYVNSSSWSIPCVAWQYNLERVGSIDKTLLISSRGVALRAALCASMLNDLMMVPNIKIYHQLINI